MQEIQDTLLKIPEIIKNILPKKKQKPVDPVTVPVATTPPDTTPAQQQPQPKPIAPPNVAETNPTLPPTLPPATPGARKNIIIGVIVLAIFLIIMVVTLSFFGGVPKIEDVIDTGASPTPTPTPVEVIDLSSQYADDPEVIEIMEKVKEFEKELNNTTLREDTLRVPVVDWEISF